MFEASSVASTHEHMKPAPHYVVFVLEGEFGLQCQAHTVSTKIHSSLNLVYIIKKITPSQQCSQDSPAAVMSPCLAQASMHCK